MPAFIPRPQPPRAPLGALTCSLGPHFHFLPKQFANVKPCSSAHNCNFRFIAPSWLLRLQISTDRLGELLSKKAIGTASQYNTYFSYLVAYPRVAKISL